MKYLYNKKGRRWGDGDRHSFAFFAIGAVVVLAAAFVIGLQVGRVVEKKSAAERQGKDVLQPAAGKAAVPAGAGNDIGKNLRAFSEEAGKVPAVPPPDAKSAAAEVEKGLTFQDTLSRKEAGPAALVAPATPKDPPPSAKKEVGKRFVVQAGSFRDKGKAESFRKRLAQAGFTVRLVRGTGKNRERYYRVLVGPYTEREAARKAVEKLKSDMHVEARVLPGGAG